MSNQLTFDACSYPHQSGNIVDFLNGFPHHHLILDLMIHSLKLSLFHFQMNMTHFPHPVEHLNSLHAWTFSMSTVALDSLDGWPVDCIGVNNCWG